MPTIKYSKQQWATAIAVLFHCIGLVGILLFKSDLIIKATPLNLLLMFGLVLWTQERPNSYFIVFLLFSFLVGIAVEIIGVNTQLLFGNYSYGAVLGFKLKGVPVMIGINWFIIIYCCGISIHTLLTAAIDKMASETSTPPMALRAISVIADGATLAVFFDWIMEPVAVKLNFWQWNEAEIPLYNYICWFGVSMLLLAVFHFCKFSKRNKFAVHLLLIQAMFFLILRTFLP